MEGGKAVEKLFLRTTLFFPKYKRRTTDDVAISDWVDVYTCFMLPRRHRWLSLHWLTHPLLSAVSLCLSWRFFSVISHDCRSFIVIWSSWGFCVFVLCLLVILLLLLLLNFCSLSDLLLSLFLWPWSLVLLNFSNRRWNYSTKHTSIWSFLVCFSLSNQAIGGWNIWVLFLIWFLFFLDSIFDIWVHLIFSLVR